MYDDTPSRSVSRGPFSSAESCLGVPIQLGPSIVWDFLLATCFIYDDLLQDKKPRDSTVD